MPKITKELTVTDIRTDPNYRKSFAFNNNKMTGREYIMYRSHLLNRHSFFVKAKLLYKSCLVYV